MKKSLQKSFKALFLCSIFLTLSTVSAQAPNKMSYQAVIRNASNVLVSNANIGVKISILQTTATGTVVYAETHASTTNTNGLATLQIGGGTIISGNFGTINWGNGPFFIKTETDPNGGANYTISGTSQLLSVPFALYAASGNPGPQGTQGIQGLPGTNGSNGATGSQGLTGAIGATGAAGSQGPIGLTGGIGATGAQGSQGPIGLTGATGATGSQGSQGPIGLTGAIGATGAQGIQGVTGATGPQGIPGSTSGSWTTTGANIANNNAGNVGIGTGTTAPFSILTVKKDGIGFTQEDVSSASRVGFYTATTGAWLQTHSNTDLSFTTNDGATQMTLQKGSGNFGINVISPTEKLEVNGKTKTTNLQVTNGSGTGKVLTSDATGNATWQNAGAGTGWSQTGNAGTNPTTNFIGTTDNNDLVFKRNSIEAGKISSQNTSFGYSSLNPLSTGIYNVAIGSNAMEVNTTGGYNTSNGYYSMKNNTTGFSNTATGYGSLRNNSDGNDNTANGAGALFGNINGYKNTAVGSNALGNNTSGNENIAVGNNALSGNISGNENTALGNEALKISNSSANTAVGSKALWKDTTGNLNVAIGNNAMVNNTIGYENVAVGFSSLFNLVSGVNNVVIGTSAGSNIINGSNNTIIGNGAVSPSGGNNQVRIGNTAITYAGIQVAWSITSDKRWKSNIQPSNLGLDFIKKLNPVSYFRNNDESKKTEYGFIAQELETSLISSNASNNGIITKDDAGMFSVRYNDLLAPMVKAIQELEVENKTLKIQNEDLEKRLKVIEEKLSK